MHAQTRRGLLVAGAFGCSAIAAALAPTTTPWLALHLFLIGSVTTSIVSVTLMMAVTWSGAPAPRSPAITTQRWVIALGAILVTAGRAVDRPALAGLGACVVAVALALGIVLLTIIRRTARTDRFAPAIDAYVLAFAAAVVGVTLGGIMATNTITTDVRDAHVIVNLFAFVGVVIAGTLPSFTATQARTKMSRRATPRHLRLLVATLWTPAVVAALAVAAGMRAVTGVLIVLHGVAFLAVAALLPRLGRKQLDWAGPRLVQLFCGVGWWGAMTIVMGARFDRFLVDRAPLIALVVGGLAQILVASFAYLVPVVRGGGHESLTANFARSRSWLGLVLGNTAAVAGLTGQRAVLVVTLVVWAVDTALRLVPVGRTRAADTELAT